MKPEFQEEWRDFEVPDERARRIRDGAWARLREPAPVRRSLWKLAAPWAAAAGVLMAWWLWPYRGSVPESPRAQVELPAELPTGAPTPKFQGEPDSTLPQSTLPKPLTPPHSTLRADAGMNAAGESAPPTEPAPPGRPSRETVSTATDQSPSSAPRLVFNFRLPKSGVQLIWVKDEAFQVGEEK